MYFKVNNQFNQFIVYLYMVGELKFVFFLVIILEFVESCGVIDFLQRVGNNIDISLDIFVFVVQLVEKFVLKLEFFGIYLDIILVLIEIVVLRILVDNFFVFCVFFIILIIIIQRLCIKEFCLNIDFQGKLSV